MKIKKIVDKKDTLLYLIFDNDPEIRVLDLKKFECDYCLQQIDKLTIDEFGGLEFDAANSICPDMAYEKSRQIHKDELLLLINKLVMNKELSTKKLSRSIGAALV